MKTLFLLVSTFLFFSSSTYAMKIEPCESSECREYYKHFKLNAKRGNANAIATLAEFYYHGYGTPKNLVRAMKNYRDAARMGIVRSQYKAGLMHLIHERFEDIDKGVKYLEKAAFNHHQNAAYLLGIIYYSDQFGEHDKTEADKWLAKAYQNNHRDMPEFIEHIYSFEDVTESTFPQLYAAMDEKPLLKTANNTLVWPDDGTERITVRAPDINAMLGDQLKQFRKKIRRTGTRLPGINCKTSVACRALTQDEMKDSIWMTSSYQ